MTKSLSNLSSEFKIYTIIKTSYCLNIYSSVFKILKDFNFKIKNTPSIQNLAFRRFLKIRSYIYPHNHAPIPPPAHPHIYVQLLAPPPPSRTTPTPLNIPPPPPPPTPTRIFPYTHPDTNIQTHNHIESL